MPVEPLADAACTSLNGEIGYRSESSDSLRGPKKRNQEDVMSSLARKLGSAREDSLTALYCVSLRLNDRLLLSGILQIIRHQKACQVQTMALDGWH